MTEINGYWLYAGKISPNAIVDTTPLPTTVIDLSTLAAYADSKPQCNAFSFSSTVPQTDWKVYLVGDTSSALTTGATNLYIKKSSTNYYPPSNFKRCNASTTCGGSG